MADPAVLALEVLYENVVARFALEGPYIPGGGTPVPQPFGWRFVAQHHVGPRIVWVPGNPLGAAGRFSGPRNPGGGPRSLGTLVEQFHVVISSNDASAPEDERLNYRATRLLHDAWFRAVYLAAHGTILLDSGEWITEQLERRFGTAIRVIGTIQSMIPDVTPSGPDYELAPDDMGAELEVSELDNTETLTVEPS
jgi:hypothetical protein